MYLKKQISAVILLSILIILTTNLNAALVTWTGATNTDWNTASNWDISAVPTVIDTVLFNSGINNCVITGTVSMARLRIEAGYDGTLTIDGATLSISGDASLSGASGDSLYLQAGSTAYINATGNIYSNYAVLGNINSSGGSQGKAFYSRDAGGNTNWLFMPSGLKYWDGGGIDNNWSTVENWMPDGVPSNQDSVVFDITSNKNCMVNSASTVRDLVIESSFTGTFSLGSSTISITKDCKIANYSSGFTSDIGGFSFSGATSQTFEPMTSIDNPNIIVTNSSDLIINSTSNFAIKTLTVGAGSSITPPSSFEFIIRNNFTNNGTFNNNGGIVVMDSTGGVHTIQSGGSQFNILRINGAGATYTLSDNVYADTIDIATGTLELGTGLTHTVQNIYSGSGGSLNFGTSTLQVSNQAGFENLTSMNMGDGTLEFNGGGTQLFNPGTFENPHILISSIGPVQVNSASNTTFRSLTINSGASFNAPSSFSLTIRDSILNNGTFNHNSGTVVFDSTGGTHSIDMGASSFYKLNFTGTATYQFMNNIAVDDTLSISGATVDMGSGYTHAIMHISALAATGTLNLNNSTIDLLGNANFSNLMSLQWMDNGVIHCMGSSPQSIIPYGTIDHPSLSISNNTDVSISGLANDVTFRDLNINSGGVFTAPNAWKLKLRSSFINNGTFNHNNGTVEFDSTSGTHDINSVSPFNTLNINGMGATYQFTSDIQATTLSIQNGILDMGNSFTHTIDSITSMTGSSTINFNSSRVLITGNLQIDQISSITAGTDTLEFNGIGSQYISAPASIEIGHILHNGIGTLNLNNNLDVSSYTQTDGVLNMNTFDLNVQSSGNLIVTKGNINSLDARQIMVTGDASFTGIPGDSVYLTPATTGYLNVSGNLTADYAVIGNIDASSGSQGIATNSRNAGGNVNWAFPPTTTVDLFFSVGTNTANLLTSSSFSTNGDTATFGTPQSDYIGVGDRIDYDGGFEAYIKERLSSTQYIIRKANGSYPDSSTVQVDAIYRAFNSLNSALDSLTLNSLLGTTNLKAINARLHIACYADSTDTTAVNISGIETGPQNGISIFSPGPIDNVGIPQNHHGMWTPDGYQLSVSGTGISGRVVWIQVPYVKIHGLQIEYTGSNANAIQVISVNGDSCDISNNIIKLKETTPPNQRMGIYIGGAYYTRISNNLIYDFIGGTSNDAGIYTSTGQTDMAMPVYNNTVFNCAIGINSFPNNAVLTKNNLVYACSTNFGGASFAAASANNLSGPSQTNAPGTSSLQGMTVSFFDQGSGNFRLMAGSPAIDAGTNLTNDPLFALDDDITFQPRDASFDIGAYEYRNTNPNLAILDTFVSGEIIVTNTVPYNINLQFDLSDSDTLSYIKYHIQIDNNADFSSPEIDTIESILAQSPRNNVIYTASLNTGSFYWRVETIDQYNATSGWITANSGSVAFTIDGPDAPIDITLSNLTINENLPDTSILGILSTVDSDVGNTFTYSFYAGPGDSNNSSFVIVGDTIKTVSTFNYENQSNYSILINTTDNTSLSVQKQFTITVNNINESPTAISLSDTTIDENLPPSTAVGTLTSLDEDSLESFTYQLVAGVGDTDNSSFTISGNSLLTAASFDYETKNIYYIRIQTTDAGSLTFENSFIITINDIYEDTATQMPSLALPASNDTIHNFPTIDFTLPEAALSGSVKMTFMQTGGTSDFNSPHEIIFSSSFESSGNHTTILNSKDLNNNTNVSSVSSNPNDFLEHEGIYSVKIGYQDSLGNPLSEVIASNIMFIDTVTPGPSPIIVSSAYYESNNVIKINFDKKVKFIDSTKNLYLSTDNGIKDTVAVQAPWSWSYSDTTFTSIEINVPSSDISFLEGLPNKNFLEIAMQDSTFGDSIAWNFAFNYSANFSVIYYYNTAPLSITSATFVDSTSSLILNFNDTISSIDTNRVINIMHSTDSTLAVSLGSPLTYTLSSAKNNITIAIPDADMQYIKSWNNIDTSLILVVDSSVFTSGSKNSSSYLYDNKFKITFEGTLVFYNMFNISLNNLGDSLIEAYLYFINENQKDTGNGIYVSYGFGQTQLDTTQDLWAYKDSSFIVPNTVKQGYWYFTWAPVSLNGTLGEIFTDSILINNIKPNINLDSLYNIYEDSLWQISNFISDKNNDSISLILLNSPDNLIIDNKSVIWKPDNDDVGISSFSIAAIDSWGDTTKAAIKLNIINTNDIPVLDTVSIADTIYEDSVLIGYIKAYDIDKNDSLKLFIEPDSSWIKLTSSEHDSLGNYKFQITLSPENNNTGIQSIKYHIQDNSGVAVAYFDTVFVVNTNDAPTISLASKIVNHGAVSVSYKTEDDFDTTFTYILNLQSTSTNLIDTNQSGLFKYYPLEDNDYIISCTVLDNENLSDISIDSFTISGSSKKIINQSTNWDMVTIPVNNYSANSFKTAGTILHWDETKEATNIYKYYTRENGIASLSAGNSYFIKNSDSTISISLSADSLIKDTFSLTLNSGEFGWNQIGSPYTFPVKVNDSSYTFWEYDPSIKDYVDAQGILMPWKGYWVQSDQSTIINLQPDPYMNGTRSRHSVSRHKGAENWIYTITLTSEISQDRDNFFGFTPDAENGKDRFDRPEAPRLNDAPYLFFRQNQWHSTIKQYASDVRKKRSSEDFFSIGISGSSENTNDMRIKILGYYKNDDVYLFARTSNGISPYEPESEIIIKASQKDQYITLISSSKPELNIPLSFKTFSPFPNPCKLIANIKYTLPYSWEADGSMIESFNVKISVYDIKGRVIKELVNSKQQPGVHKVIWNGSNSNGSAVASGAYFVKINAGKHRAVKKIMLMK